MQVFDLQVIFKMALSNVFTTNGKEQVLSELRGSVITYYTYIHTFICVYICIYIYVCFIFVCVHVCIYV